MQIFRAEGVIGRLKREHTNAICRATFGTMLFELCDAGSQFKQHCPKSRVGRRAGNHVGVNAS